MGRLDATPVPQSADQTPLPPPQGYPTQPPPPPPPSQDAYMADDDQNKNHQQSTRSYIPQPTEQPPPPSPQAYPPQQAAAFYPPQPQPMNYPPQQQPAAYPPQQQQAAYPPQQPTSYINPQNYKSTDYNVHPQMVNYGGTQMPGTPNGIPIGGQYLAPTQGWSSGLLDCMDDPENAIMTFCFPCVTFGQIAEILDNGQTSCATSGLIYSLITAFIGIPCIMSCSYRSKIRSRYGLMETPAPDWATHFLCEYCALCQEYREIKARGMDPAIGWQGNMSKNQQMAMHPTMTPPMNQRMMG